MALDEKPEDGEVVPGAPEPDEGRDQHSEPIQSDDEPQDSSGADETDELDEDQESEEIDAQPRSRSSGRIQRLSNEAREARTRAEAAERRLQELETRLSQQSQPAPREPSAEEMALWDPDRVMQYRMQKSLEPVQRELQQVRAQAWEQGDKAAFAAMAARDPRAARMAEQVEQRLQQLRSQGQNIEREKLYTYMVGELALKRGPQAKQAQAKQGQERIARQQARPGNARSDQQGGRRVGTSEADARNERLKRAGFM